jgi:hypothetical protein
MRGVLARFRVPAAILLASLLASSSSRPGSSAPTLGAAEAAGAAERSAPAPVVVARLPLAFQPNSGQAPSEVRYVSRAADYRLWLTGSEARFAPSQASAAAETIRLRWIGGAAAPALTAEDQLPGKAHYFTGPDSSHWRRNVPMYGRVVYRGVYPGIDLVFHGDQRQTEFDFLVAPGADARAIRLELDGARDVALEEDDVVVRMSTGDLRLHKPVVYQERAGRRVPVEGRLTLDGRRVAFEVGAYDRARPLVIDPVVTYSTYLGGAGSERGRRIGVDGAGNMYALVDGMGIVKLSADGTTLLYTVVLGDAVMSALAVDSAGHAYVAGTWPQPRSGVTTHYPVTANALRPTPGQPCAQGDSDGVMAKLSPDGATLLYSSFAGGNCSQRATAIAVDGAGNFYVAGEGSSTGGLPSTRAPFQPASGTPSPFPAWIQAVAADFSRYLYAVLILGQDGGRIEPTAIAAGGDGNAYLTGRAMLGFPTTAGAFQSAPGSGFTAPFVTKIAPGASAMRYGTYFANDQAYVQAIAVDGSGNAYLAGVAGSGLPTAGALQPTLAGGTDAFVAKLDPSGSGLVFSTYLGGARDDAATAIGLDGAGNVYVAGPTDSIDFPQKNPLPPGLGAAGSNFVTALAPSGATLVSSTYFADAPTFLEGMTVTRAGVVFVTGTTTSTSFPTVRPYQAAPGGGGDAFIARIEPQNTGGTCPTGQFLAEYFGNIALTAPAIRTACESAISYSFGAGGPTGLPVDNFSARWTGTFEFAAGTFTFTARADDGVRMFLDGVAIIDQWRDQSATTYTASRTLSAGLHEVKVEYYERFGSAVIQARWTGGTAPAPTLTTLTPGSATAGGPAFTLTLDGSHFISGAMVMWNGVARAATFVSATRLTTAVTASDIAAAGSVAVAVRNPDLQPSNARTFTIAPASGGNCAGGQFFVEYFGNVTLAPPATRAGCESSINHDFGAGGPAGLPVDNFSARWRGRVPFVGGNVTFTARADDGVRVFVDGGIVIDAWHDQAATTYTATRFVPAGEHEVRVDYYERGGAAVIQVAFTAAALPSPTLTTLTPSRAAAGGPGFTLTADGRDFVSGATLLWNGVPRTTAFVSPTRLTANIVASDIATAGSASVTVRNPDGRVSNAQTFTVGGASDTVRVFITAPSGGATVRGTVWFTVWIENAAAGPRTCDLSVGGAAITSASTTSNGPVSLAWPTSTADNGARTATVTVRDGSGGVGSASVTLTVAN